MRNIKNAMGMILVCLTANRGLCPGGIGGKREDYHRRFRHTAYPGEESAGY